MSHLLSSYVGIFSIESVSRKSFCLQNRTYVLFLVAINLSSLWCMCAIYPNYLKNPNQPRRRYVGGWLINYELIQIEEDQEMENILQSNSGICSRCSEEISPEISKPIVLLSCSHVVHFACIDDKRRLCPECPSINELEKEGYYISPITAVSETLKKTPKETRR